MDFTIGGGPVWPWRPASYNGPHAFPMNHGGANACGDCHSSSLVSYSCYGCHSSSEMQDKHKEITNNFGDCTGCHPNGRKEEGGDD